MALPPLRSIAERSLVYADQLFKECTAAYKAALDDKAKPPPSHFNNLQVRLANQQADEDIREIAGLLEHAKQKLQWELHQKWKH